LLCTLPTKTLPYVSHTCESMISTRHNHTSIWDSDAFT
jgi:hypothetical protein